MTSRPNIRFEGYTDDWEQRKLEAEADIIAGGDIDKTLISDSGKYPVVANSPENGGILGYYENDYRVEAPAVTVAGRGVNIGYAEARTVNFTPVVRLLSVKSKHDIYFMENAINNHKVVQESTGVPQLTVPQLGSYKLWFPSDLKEEIKIGDFIHNLDYLITLHQRKCDETKELKKYMLQKMFPKNGEKRPEIRFEGFNDDWEQRKLGELYEINTERNKDLIGYNKTFSIATMTYKDEGNGAADSSLATYKVLRIGDIAFEGHTNKEFRYGRFVANDVGDGIMSPRFSTLRPISKMPVSFWKYYIHYEPIMRKILVCSTKAGTMMNELVPSDFFAQNILVPSIEEQGEIGSYLNQLDTLITLHQRKCDQLKDVKEFMLRNMFPGRD